MIKVQKKLFITKVQSDIVISLFFSLLIFIFSLWLIDFYQNGDQSHYRKYWKEVQGLDFFDFYALLVLSLGSAEPGYALLTYLFSGVIKKDIIMSILNSSIVYFLVRWMLGKQVYVVLIPFLLLTFYLLLQRD